MRSGGGRRVKRRVGGVKVTYSRGGVSAQLHFWTTDLAHVIAPSQQGHLGCSSVDVSLALCPR